MDEAPRPVYVRIFGTNAVVPRAPMDAHALQQLGLLRGGGSGIRRGGGMLWHPQNLGLAKRQEDGGDCRRNETYCIFRLSKVRCPSFNPC